MNIEPNAKNVALASAVNSRINAEAMMVKAKAAGLRLAGIGALCFLAGAGTGLAFFGYSYLKDATSASERMAEAIGKALERTTLRTTGSVAIDPASNKVVLAEGTIVGLDPDARVKLDASGATVRLDPNARIEVITPMPQYPRPTPDQRNGKGTPRNNHPVTTGFTVFKSVKYGNGIIHTGWKFNSSDEPAPYYQYCYYGQGFEESVQVMVELAVDGFLNPKAKRGVIDNARAAENCIWFDGAPTRMGGPTY
jgi:hypothetical protein